MSTGWVEPDLFEAADHEGLADDGSTASAVFATGAVTVGQGQLPIDGNQLDLFEDEATEDPPPTDAHAAGTKIDSPIPLAELGVLARALMDDHGLINWTFGWDRAVRRAGLTRHRHQVISLSIPLMRLFPLSEARNTILHEIAHALVGHVHGHGNAWKAKAAEIGARPERCFDSSIASIDGDWTAICSAGHTKSRHRAPKHFVTSCGICAPGTFDTRFLRTWYWRGIPVLRPGTTIELIGNHAWTGQRGIITRLKDTPYLVALSNGRDLNVPFTLVTVPGDDYIA